MKSSILLLITIIWIPFTYWSISHLRKLQNQPNGSAIYRRGALGFGIPLWLVEIIFTAATIPDRDIYSIFLWATIFIYISFPLCLWAGFFWGKGMAAIFPGAHDR
ncbi:hypothetical protein [Ralstonia pickettii]|uniref:hypothetical protein n=1 Tax=Ralstonia pickettii TaxID=329 RepID=UPI00117FCF08|nr:hypothetical protein [Ralstonia pickettii]